MLLYRKCRSIIDLRLKIFTYIPIPLHALCSVLDCSCRAGGDARHAMRAVFAPFGAGGCKFYIIKRADLYAHPTRNAFIGRIEFIGFYEEFIENRINGTAHEFIVKIVPHGGKMLVSLYKYDGFIHFRDGFF